MRCLLHVDSPWRQSYISLIKDSWWEGGLADLSNSTWVDSILCDIRVTFARETKSLVTPLLSQKLEPGFYTYMATVRNAVSSAQASCMVQVQPKVSGLQLIYPEPLGGKLNLVAKQKVLLVVRIGSGCKAVAHWMSPVNRAEVAFVDTCPADIMTHVPACFRDATDTWFSSVQLMMDEPRDEEILDIVVSNEVSTQKLSVKIQFYDAIEGLQVVPPGPCRMLVDVTQVDYDVHIKSRMKYGSDITCCILMLLLISVLIYYLIIISCSCHNTKPNSFQQLLERGFKWKMLSFQSKLLDLFALFFALGLK